MVDLAYDWSLMGWGMRAIVIALAVVLAIVLVSPHVAVLKPIAEKLGLATTATQVIYVPVNHTIYVNRTIYVNQTVVRYINQTVPIYINRTVYVPVGLNESLSSYLNDLFGWNGLRCWIVTFVYDNATPYFYVGNESTWGSMATIGTMVIPRQLLGEFYQWIQAGPNSTYYYPYGVLQILGFPETFIYTTNTSNGLVELEGFSGELFEPNATNAPVVYLFGDWPGTGPITHFYAAVINNTGGYMVVTPPPWSVNATAVFYYNRTYTVLFFPTVMSGGLIQGVATPFACNWTVIGPVDPSAIMRYPIPYAWTQSEVAVALTKGYLSTSAIEQTYEYDTFGWWVWNMNVTIVNASLPYPTS
jgi:hypothetical protein